jgi:elongation factor 1-beta
MGFSLGNEAGLPALEEWLKTRSYIDGYAPSQADVAALKAITYSVDAGKFPNVSRWRRHIKTFEDEFSILKGDASKPHTAYGPTAAEAVAADEDDVDLFGSDDEEEDEEAAKIREQRLADYAKKKAAKGAKPAAKSIVILDVKVNNVVSGLIRELTCHSLGVSLLSGVVPVLTDLMQTTKRI